MDSPSNAAASIPPRPLGEGEGGEGRARRAFVEALGALGDYYHDQYGDGNRLVISALRAEEPNLLHARRLARQVQGAQGVLAPGVGHVWNLQAPDLFSRMVWAWVRGEPLPRELKVL